jgi:hypothetical protein
LHPTRSRNHTGVAPPWHGGALSRRPTCLPLRPTFGATDRRFIAQLNLPSKIVYMMATSHIPILVLGNRDTGAAHFVDRFGIDVVADYARDSFVRAVDTITRPEVNLEMRRRALAVAGRFTDVGAAEWIWQSLARGEPIDGRYESLVPTTAPREPSVTS